MSENLINNILKERLYSMGVSMDIDVAPHLIQTVQTLADVQRFITELDNSHPDHELTEYGKKFLTSLKEILIRNLDDYNTASFSFIPYEDYDYSVIIEFYNFTTDEMKVYEFGRKQLKISQFIKTGHKNSKVKEYERALFLKELPDDE